MQRTFEADYVAWRERHYIKIKDKWVSKKYSWLKYSNDHLLSYYERIVSKGRGYLVEFADLSIVVTIQQQVDAIVLGKFLSAIHGRQVLRISPISSEELQLFKAAGIDYHHYRSLY